MSLSSALFLPIMLKFANINYCWGENGHSRVFSDIRIFQSDALPTELSFVFLHKFSFFENGTEKI